MCIYNLQIVDVHLITVVYNRFIRNSKALFEIRHQLSYIDMMSIYFRDTMNKLLKDIIETVMGFVISNDFV